MNLTETIAWARSVPRSARVAQGYPKIRDFAHHIMRVRDERAKRRAMPALSHEQQGIVERLQAALDADPILRRMARAEADMRPHDPIPCRVVFVPDEGDPFRLSRVLPAERGSGFARYHWRNGRAKGTVYHPSSRHVSVPAAWLLAKLRAMTSGTGLAQILARHLQALLDRERARRERSERAASRLMAIPHWLDRVASGAMPMPRGLPKEMREQIEKRRSKIDGLRYKRKAHEKKDYRVAVAHMWYRGCIPITGVAARTTKERIVRYVDGHRQKYEVFAEAHQLPSDGVPRTYLDLPRPYAIVAGWTNKREAALRWLSRLDIKVSESDLDNDAAIFALAGSLALTR